MSFPVTENDSLLRKLHKYIPILENIAHFHHEESQKIKKLIDLVFNLGTQLTPKMLVDIEITCQRLCEKYGKKADIVAAPIQSDNHEGLIPINWKAGPSNKEDDITSSSQDVKPFSESYSRGFDFWTSTQPTQDNSSDVKPFSFAQLNPAPGVHAYNIKKEEPVHPSRSSGHPSCNNWSNNHSRPYRNDQQYRHTGSFKPDHRILPPPPPRGISWDKGGAHSSSGDYFRRTESSANFPRYHPEEKKVLPSSSSSWKRTDTNVKSTSSTSPFSSQPPRQPRVPYTPAPKPEAHQNGNPCRFSAPLHKSLPQQRNADLISIPRNNAQESSSNYQCFNPPSLPCDAVDEVDGPSSSPSFPVLPPMEPSPTYSKSSAPCPSSSNRRSPSNAQLQCSTISQSTLDRPHDHDSTREPVDKYTSPLDSLYSGSGSKLQTGRGYGSQSANRRSTFVRSNNSCSSVPSACGNTEPSSSTTQHGSSSTVKKTPPAASHLTSDESEEDSTFESVPFKVKAVRKKLDVSTPVFVPLGRKHPRGFIDTPQEDQVISDDPEDDIETNNPEQTVDPVPTVVDLESPSCAPKRRKGVVKKAITPSTHPPSTSVENPDRSVIECGTVSRNEGIRSSHANPQCQPSFSAASLEPPVKKKRGRPRKDGSDAVGNVASQQRSASNERTQKKRQPENVTTSRPKQPRSVSKELENLYEGFKDYLKDGPILNGRRSTRTKPSSSKEPQNDNESSDQDDDCLTATTSGELSHSNSAVPSISNTASSCESSRSKERDTQVARSEFPSTSSACDKKDSGETQVDEFTHPTPNQDEAIDLFGTQLYLCGNLGCDVRTETPRELEDHLIICDLARDSPKLICKHCGITWKQVVGLMVHLKQHGSRRYSCGICKIYRNTQARKIHAHLKEAHGVTRNIVEVVMGKGPGADYPGNNMYVLRPRDK